MVQVRYTVLAWDQYRGLPLTIRTRVADALGRLANWPEISGAKPLRGSLKGHFRLRIGDWRIVFRPVGDAVWIMRIDNRKDVYEV